MTSLAEFIQQKREKAGWSIYGLAERASIDIETLEDIITTAMDEATTKASDEMNKRMKQITGGIKIPGLNF